MNKLLLFSVLYSSICFSQFQPNGFKNGQEPFRNYPENNSPTFNSNKVVTRPFKTNNEQKISTVTANRFTGSMNAFGVLISESKPLQYNPAVNAISFIHRKSPTYVASSNNNSGAIVAMYSTNNGLSWDSTCIWANSLNFGRNPQGAIWSPPGNTNLINTYMVGCGPLNNGAGWDGNWYASKPLSGGGTSTPGIDQQTHLSSFPILKKHEFSHYSFTAIEGGQIRSIGNLMSDPNGVSNVTRGLRGAAMVKGQFNAGAFVWSVDSFVPCIMNRADGSKYINEKMIQAWDENGIIGYAIMLGVRCSVGPCLKSYQPIVYKTTNSGASWILMTAANFATYPFLLDRLYPVNTNSSAIVPYFSSNEGIDATVDFNGNLHLACTVLGAYSAHNDSLDYIHSFGSQQYSYSYGKFGFPTIYDFYTTSSGGWNIHVVDSMGTEAPIGSFGSLANIWSNGMIGKLDYNARIQMSRTKDGKKLFYSWSESDSSVVGLKWNIYPDIKISGFDITTNKRTQRFNASYGVLYADQESYFHYMSPKTISTGTTSFEIPLTISHNAWADGSIPMNHFHLKGATMTATDFTINASMFGGSGFSTCFTLDMENGAKENGAYYIYPNPTSDEISIALKNYKIQTISVEILDISGRILKRDNKTVTEGENSIPLKLTDYQSGLYFIKLSIDGHSETVKIIKQ